MIKVKVLAVGSDGGTTDISDVVGEFKIKGASKECARTLDMKIIRDDVDEEYPTFKVNLGDSLDITVIEDDKASQAIKAVVWEKQASINEVSLDIVGYDRSIYLNKNETETQVFNDMTADAVAKKIIGELGLTAGNLAPGIKDNYNCRGMTAYDAIMHAYTKTSRKNGKKYKLVADGDKINVFEASDTVDVVLEELDEPVVGKLLDLSYKESLDDLVNEVKVIEEDEKDEKKEKKSDAESQKRYGAIQKIIKGKKEDIAGIMAGAKKELDVECIGSWDMVTGKSIEVKSDIISGEFYIIDDEHVINDGTHICNLTLSTEFEMDEKEEGQSENKDSDSTSAGKGKGSANIEKGIAWAQKQLGTPYSQPNRMRPGYFDCSSFAYEYGRQMGVLPDANWAWTTQTIPGNPNVVEVPYSEMKRGDLICNPNKHVEIYLGGGEIIHSTPPSVRYGKVPGPGSGYRVFRFKGA